MDPLLALAVVAILAVVVLVVGYPLLRPAAPADESGSERIAALELQKEAKYREIRDAEVDFRTKKLSEADYRELDRSLRREAIEILHEIDSVKGEGPGKGEG